MVWYEFKIEDTMQGVWIIEQLIDDYDIWINVYGYVRNAMYAVQ